MISKGLFQNMTCQDLDKETLWAEYRKGENLKGALGIRLRLLYKKATLTFSGNEFVSDVCWHIG